MGRDRPDRWRHMNWHGQGYAFSSWRGSPSPIQGLRRWAHGQDRLWRGLVGVDLGTAGAGGCGWVFPKREHLSVGVAAHQWDARGIRSLYDRFVARRGLSFAPVLRRCGHRLPIRPPGSPIQSGRVLLAGDAAGLVDAFTGEGIYWAVRSGKLAAAAVQELLEGRAQDLSGYERRVDRELMPELLAARQWVNVYLWAPALSYLLLRHSDRFRRAVCQIIRGERGYQDIAPSLGPLGVLTSLLPMVGGRHSHANRSRREAMMTRSAP